MVTFIAVIHILTCLILIALVLLQDPKSSGSGFLGAGGSNTVFGSTGATSVMTQVTRYAAIIFGITCLVLTFVTKPQTGSVMDSGAAAATAPVSVPVPVETTPAAPAKTETPPAQK